MSSVNERCFRNDLLGGWSQVVLGVFRMLLHSNRAGQRRRWRHACRVEACANQPGSAKSWMGWGWQSRFSWGLVGLPGTAALSVNSQQTPVRWGEAQSVALGADPVQLPGPPLFLQPQEPRDRGEPVRDWMEHWARWARNPAQKMVCTLPHLHLPDPTLTPAF